MRNRGSQQPPKVNGHKARQTQREAGFSLIELLIVVAIIAIIVAIAVPNFLSARRAAQSSSMMGDLRTIHSAETAFYTGPGKSSYGDFSALEGNRFLPISFSTGATAYNRHGYSGNLTLGSSNASFNVIVNHSSFSATAPSYFINETGTIRFNTTGLASSTDRPVGTQ
jgi:prepilin-type N-terminal cleavage/methylation domain-containing protein